MPFFVWITDGNGSVLSREECEPADRGVAQAALERIRDYMIGQVITSGTSDIKSPLTVHWGEADT